LRDYSSSNLSQKNVNDLMLKNFLHHLIDSLANSKKTKIKKLFIEGIEQEI
jgi:hypothetical protein